MGQVAQLQDLLRECHELDDNHIRIQAWRGLALGKLFDIFPNNQEVHEHWRSINDDWDGLSPFTEPFYDTTLDDDENSYEQSNMENDYLLFCYRLRKQCRQALQEYIALLTSQGSTGILTEPREIDIDINFLEDEYRNYCRSRIIEAVICAENKCYLPAMISLGSALECLLMGITVQIRDKVKASSTAPQKKIEDWKFIELLKFAEAEKWIQGHAVDLANWVREFRNAVHADNAMKKMTTPSPDLWGVCYHAFSETVSQLREWVSRNSQVTP